MTDHLGLKHNIHRARTLLKLSTIPRWGIVEMIRPQSVGEHSYNVWVMATSLYDYMYETNHNSFERRAVEEWALTHDADEVFTGDIPTTVKEILNRITPGATAALKEEVLRGPLPDILARARGLKNSLPYVLVAIADVAEAVLFLQIYAIRTEDRMYVNQYLMSKLQKKVEEGEKIYPGADWKRCMAWVQQLLEVPPSV